jgi:hypothetical protein
MDQLLGPWITGRDIVLPYFLTNREKLARSTIKEVGAWRVLHVSLCSWIVELAGPAYSCPFVYILFSKRGKRKREGRNKRGSVLARTRAWQAWDRRALSCIPGLAGQTISKSSFAWWTGLGAALASASCKVADWVRAWWHIPAGASTHLVQNCTDRTDPCTSRLGGKRRWK